VPECKMEYYILHRNFPNLYGSRSTF